MNTIFILYSYYIYTILFILHTYYIYCQTILTQYLGVFLGENAVGFSTDVQLGTYQPLGGSFSLSIEGVSSASIAINAPASVVASALLALPTVKNITVSMTSGITTYFGKQYRGNTWLVTFNSVLQSQYQGVVDMTIDDGAVSGRDSVAVHQELVTGNGPLFPVEITFDSQVRRGRPSSIYSY